MNQMDPGEGRKQIRGGFLVGILLGLLVIAVFSQVAGHHFINYDDQLYVSANATVARGLTLDGVRWAFTSISTGAWHPVTWFSHLLDMQLYGVQPGPHHITSVILHLFCVLLLFYFLLQSTGDLLPSFLTASLFALHPLHVESVAWISERKDVLSALFWILAMIAYMRYVKTGKRLAYMWLLVCFVLGLMSKSMLVTLPFALLLLDYWPFQRIDGIWSKTPDGVRRLDPAIPGLVYEKMPLFLLSALSSVLVFWTQRTVGAMATLAQQSIAERIANAVLAYGAYLFKTILPTGLSVFYPMPDEPSWIAAAGILILLAAATGIFLYSAERRRFAVTGWLWYLGTLVPVIGIVQIGSQRMADRYTYLPLIGIFIVFSWTLQEIVRKFRRQGVGWLVAGSLTAAAALLSYQQVGYWRTSVTLFQHALEVDPNNYIALNNLGRAWVAIGRVEEGIENIRRAVAIKPHYTNGWFNLGLIENARGNLDAAEAYMHKAIEMNPDDVDFYQTLGLMYNQQGKSDKALEIYQKSLQIKPDQPFVHFFIGNIAMQSGDEHLAVRHFRKALEQKPDFPQALHNLAVASGKTGDPETAIQSYRRLVELLPGDPNPCYNLAVLLARQGDLARAHEMLRRSIKAGFRDWPKMRAEPAFELILRLPEFRQLSSKPGQIGVEKDTGNRKTAP